jgi:hypothetical protein
LVEANFERADAGALALALFHRGDDVLAVLAQIAQLIKLGVIATADNAGIGREGGRLVGNGALEALAHVGELIDLVVEEAEEVAAAFGRSGEKIFEHGDGRERFSKGNQFPGRGEA